MNILSVETSTSNCSIAVSRDETVLRYRNVVLQRTLEKSITVWIDRVLTAAGMTLADIDGIAAGLGPGSFTSLRVGLSTVKALAMAGDLPVAGVSSLDVLARQALSAQAPVCVLMDARRKLVYGGIYIFEDGVLKQTGDYVLLPVADILALVPPGAIFVGDAVSLYKDDIMSLSRTRNAKWKLNADIRVPQAGDLAVLTASRLMSGKTESPDRLLPLYLYPEDCQVQRPKTQS